MSKTNYEKLTQLVVNQSSLLADRLCGLRAYLQVGGSKAEIDERIEGCRQALRDLRTAIDNEWNFQHFDDRLFEAQKEVLGEADINLDKIDTMLCELRGQYKVILGDLIGD